MRIYGRKEEINTIERHQKLLIIGLPGMGKATLVNKLWNPISLYIPGEKNEALICKEWKERIIKMGKEKRGKKYEPGDKTTMSELVEFLAWQNERVFIAGLQNASKVNPSFVDELIHMMKIYKRSVIIVSCSGIGECSKIRDKFRGKVMDIGELDFYATYEWMSNMDYNIEDAVRMWAVFGGIPKYYALLERYKVPVMKFIKMMFFEEPYPMLSEVKLMLKEELGREYRAYFSVLQAMSEGNSKLGDVARYMNVKITDITKYIDSLLKEHNLITRRKDVFGKGRNRYYISNNLIEFWFRMVWKNCASYEMNEVEFSESEFEKYVEKKYKQLVETLADKIIGAPVQRTGEVWGKYSSEERFEDLVDFVAVGAKDIYLFNVSCRERNREIKEKLEEIGEKIKGKKNAHVIIVAKNPSSEENVYSLIDIEKMIMREIILHSRVTVL